MDPGRSQWAGGLAERMLLSPMGSWPCSFLDQKSAEAHISWRAMGSPEDWASIASFLWTCPAHKRSRVPRHPKACLCLLPGEILLPGHTSMGDSGSSVARVSYVCRENVPPSISSLSPSLGARRDQELALAFRHPAQDSQLPLSSAWASALRLYPLSVFYLQTSAQIMIGYLITWSLLVEVTLPGCI